MRTTRFRRRREDMRCSRWYANGECRDPMRASIRSIADGVYGYDCTTGPRRCGGTEQLPGRRHGRGFEGQQSDVPGKTAGNRPHHREADLGAERSGHPLVPLPAAEPKDARLKRIAQEQQNEGTGGYYYRGCSPPWTTIFGHPEQDANDVIFIDAGGLCRPNRDDFGGTSGRHNGRLVRGRPPHERHQIQGHTHEPDGDGSAFGSTTATGDTTKGVYRVDDGSEMWGWLYAEGGTETRSGIEFGAGTTLHFRSGALGTSSTTPSRVPPQRRLASRAGGNSTSSVPGDYS